MKPGPTARRRGDLTTRGVTMEKSDIERLKIAAARMNISVAEAIRTFIAWGLEETLGES